MTRFRGIRQIAILSVTVASLCAMLLTCRSWVERSALESALGPGAETSSIQFFWHRDLGCAANVHFPLSMAEEEQAGCSAELSAGRLWFQYDRPALLRKRLILNRVVIEDAHLVVQTTTPHCSHNTSSRTWSDRVDAAMNAVRNDRLLDSTQSLSTASRFNAQWQTSFAELQRQSEGLVAEAKKIHQTIGSLDNPLRHEKQVIASGQRLDSMSLELDRMLGEMNSTEKILRGQQAEIRRAMLDDKSMICEHLQALVLPPADELASEIIDKWLVESMEQSTQAGWLFAKLISKPYSQTRVARGLDLRRTEVPTPHFAVHTARIAGDIQIADQWSPFSASGSFSDLHEYQSTKEKNLPDAIWNMTVGDSKHACELTGHFSTNGQGSPAQIEISVRNSKTGKLQLETVLIGSSMQGSGKLKLREWLTEQHASGQLVKESAEDQNIAALLDECLRTTEEVPEAIEFNFIGSVAAPVITQNGSEWMWLARKLDDQASVEIETEHDAATVRLEKRVESELATLRRRAFELQDQAIDAVKRNRDELKVLKADLIQILTERSGQRYARQPVVSGKH